jgi:hypothetical protein
MSKAESYVRFCDKVYRSPDYRVCGIYPKDVERITGKSGRSGRRLVAQIRQHYQKTAKQLISVEEFCNFTGLDIAQVKPYISE